MNCSRSSTFGLHARTGGTYDADAPADQLVEYVYADAFGGLCFVAETAQARPLNGVSDGDDEAGDEDGEAATTGE